jgi:hypothetical protein
LPEGAVQLKDGSLTTSRFIQLAPYTTQQFEYWFYFPRGGEFSHFPLHVVKKERAVAFAQPTRLTVIDVKRESFCYYFFVLFLFLINAEMCSW